MGWKLDKVLMFSKGSMNTREEGVYEERNKGCVGNQQSNILLY